MTMMTMMTMMTTRMRETIPDETRGHTRRHVLPGSNGLRETEKKQRRNREETEIAWCGHSSVDTRMSTHHQVTNQAPSPAGRRPSPTISRRRPRYPPTRGLGRGHGLVQIHRNEFPPTSLRLIQDAFVAAVLLGHFSSLPFAETAGHARIQASRWRVFGHACDEDCTWFYPMRCESSDPGRFG